MKQFRWYFALPFALTLALFNAPASGSSIRDQAGMFSAGAVSAATAQLEQFERATKVPVIIETVDSLSLGAEASKKEQHEAIEKLAIARDIEAGKRGIFLLISKADRVISNTLIPKHLASGLNETTRLEIRNAFGRGVGAHMKSEGHKSAELSDQDAGLKSLVNAIELTTEQVRASAATGHANVIPNNGLRPRQAGAPVAARAGGSSMMTFLMIGVGILAVLFFVRMIGGLFGRSGNPGGMGGGMGMGGQGMRGPGYGGPGYGGGGGGGGFLSGMMGGIGGALAGNWLYDQMSGRHGESHVDSSAYPTSGDSGGYSQGDEPIVGGDDGGSGGASWGDSGGGGGDWGGGDGGGDWGGGGGGGDWGGGGGDGGGDW